MSRALGRYELVRPLARGGMAEVFLARRRAAGVEKLLVVKRIRPERAGDARFRELFKREASLSMDLTHQNIVQTFDFGSVGDQFFLAMERVEGKDLGSSLARARREQSPPAEAMSALVAAFVAAECCQALDYAHNRRKDNAPLGVVHRDVTLRNVLVSWSGEVKLSDFGIAVLAGDDTSKLVGTPAYMAPEQARGEPLDVRTDIYAVGLVLRELLTGERARPGEDREALVAAARQGTLAPWTGDVDPALVAIVDRATAMAPADRYPTASEMHAELDAFIVAERAARRGDAPGRQLATWLAKVWGDEREREEPVAESNLDLAAGPPLMSFLDDGAAMGTGTQRSLAATAADDQDPAPAPGAPAESAAVSPVAPSTNTSPAPSTAASPRATSPTATPIVEAARVAPEVDASEVDRPPARRGVARQLAGLLVLAAITIVAIVALRRSQRSTPVVTDAAVAIAADAAPRIEPPADAAPAGVVDAAIEDAAIADAAIAVVVDAAVAVRPPDRGSATRQGSGSAAGQGSAARQGSGSQGSAARQGSGSQGSAARQGSGSQAGSAASPPQVALRKVHINATPWAFFSVDGGPKHQTPKLLELAPGPHQIHFENTVLKVERTITLVVPADRDISHVEPLR